MQDAWKVDIPHWAEFAKEVEELLGSDVEAGRTISASLGF